MSLLASIEVILFTFGIKKTSATLTQLIYTASPLLTAFFSLLILHKSTNSHKLIGLLIGFIGTTFIIILPLFENEFRINSTFIGNLIIVCAMTFYTLYSVFSKKISVQFKPIQITAVFSFTTLILLFFLSLYEIIISTSWVDSLSLKSLLAVLYVGIFGTAIYYLLVQIIIKKSSPVTSNLILYLEPIAAIILANLFLSERLTAFIIIGGLLSFIGVWLTTREEI